MRARLLGFKSETAGLLVESLVNETNILEAQLQSNVRIFCTTSNIFQLHYELQTKSTHQNREQKQAIQNIFLY